MTGTEYQKLAMRTNDRKNVDRLSDKILQLHRFNPDIPGWDSRGGFDIGGILNACLGLSGEVGEVNDMVKKWVFHESSLELDHLAKEIGDVMWYIALICDSFGFNLDTIMQTNVDKLSKRYQDGFSVYEANHRKPDDV